MLTDAHCHPFDLVSRFPQMEEERRRLGVLAAASAYGIEEFVFNEKLASAAAEDKAPALFPCFAIHPQLPAIIKKEIAVNKKHFKFSEDLDTLEKLAAAGRLAAAGECGFDLYNAEFKETESAQDEIFAAHLETALRYELPLVLHVRRAMHKIFAEAKTLAKCKAVVFHSWQGTFEEGEALLRRGVNAYFSFGNAILLNHKQAIRCCAFLPAERLLTETDAPYQPARGKSFSQWADLPAIIETAAVMRNEDAKKLEARIENNFRAVFEKII